MSKITSEDFSEYKQLVGQGLSQRAACSILDIPRTTMQGYIKRMLDARGTHSIKGYSADSVYVDEAQYMSTVGINIEGGLEKHVHSSASKPTILVIADTQAKSEESLEYLLWVGKYIAEKKPDIIVHIGDHFDLPSLSSYDKGTAKIEGKRLYKDIEAGVKGFELLNLELEKHKDYNPRKVFCVGNHEERLDRYANDNPELQGTLGVDKLPFAKYGWEVHPFLKPVEIEGIFFVHYLANPMSGKPYGGSAMNILKTVGRSFVTGHKQCLDIAIRPTIDGKQQIGIINGACYDHFESYKGFVGNNHFRGLTVLHECRDGFAVPMFVSLEYMKEKYHARCI